MALTQPPSGCSTRLLVTLLELPDNVMADMPEPLCDKLDAYLEARLEEADSQP